MALATIRPRTANGRSIPTADWWPKNATKAGRNQPGKQAPSRTLTNAAMVSECEGEVSRRYVEEGGQLLITGQGGQFDRLG
jgi:hypothetical protein